MGECAPFYRAIAAADAANHTVIVDYDVNGFSVSVNMSAECKPLCTVDIG
jgi:hypothetical protein